RDIYRLRLEEISFFIVLLFVCSFGLKLVWNYAFKGFNFVPRLKFVQAFCVSLLFGVLMLLILTMISGIREVLTPDPGDIRELPTGLMTPRKNRPDVAASNICG